MPEADVLRFALPDLGEGLTEATIVEWLVGVGDQLRVDQPVVEVETAKARVEVPVPYAGVVAALHAAAGDTVPVGATLLAVSAPSGEMGAVSAPSGEVSAPSGAVGAGSGESGQVLVGYGTSASSGPSTSSVPARRTSLRNRNGNGNGNRKPNSSKPNDNPDRENRNGNGNRPVISPLVRRLAREHHIDVAQLPGSGPDGTVLRRDVEAALSQPHAPATATPAHSAATPAHSAATPAHSAATPAHSAATSAHAGPMQRRPWTGARKYAAELYTRSRREIPEATVWVDVDATGLLAARAALNAARPEQPVSLVALLARFAVLGLRRFPELNARIESDALVLLDDVHLGFAARTDQGLVVPVVANAHTLSTRELAAAIGAHTADARAGTIKPATLSGGTFTVNNYGVFGVDGSAAIIHHPEVAILGMGRIIDRPWALDGQLAVRKVTQLTLAFDHRACDGTTAGGFLRFVADCIESPVTALGDL